MTIDATHGLVIGKFLPPHLGHVHLVDFARHWCPRLTVVVCSLRREPIPGATRVAWMRELFPSVQVIHLDEELPQDPSEHPSFWALWKAALARVVPGTPTHVFGSDAYIQRLAGELGAQAVPVDPGRHAVPVSGTAIRDDPMKHWEYLPSCVRPFFVRRICVFGPESTGKTTLSRWLAQQLHTAWVPEYARTWLEARGGHVGPGDMLEIARGQRSSEAALERQANRALILDTDTLATVVWSQALFGSVDVGVTQRASESPAGLYLLLAPDVPFVPDPVRYLPGQREAFHAACVQALESRRHRVVHIHGTWAQRQEQALASARAYLTTGLSVC